MQSTRCRVQLLLCFTISGSAGCTITAIEAAAWAVAAATAAAAAAATAAAGTARIHGRLVPAAVGAAVHFIVPISSMNTSMNANSCRSAMLRFLATSRNHFFSCSGKI